MYVAVLNEISSALIANSQSILVTIIFLATVGGITYFDTVLPMGLRITNAVCFICAQSGHGMVSYLDNFMGVSCPSEAWASFNFSAGIFQEVGLEEFSTKATPPSTRVTCFGVQFDTLAMNMSVTSERLWELEELLRE